MLQALALLNSLRQVTHCSIIELNHKVCKRSGRVIHCMVALQRSNLFDGVLHGSQAAASSAHIYEQLNQSTSFSVKVHMHSMPLHHCAGFVCCCQNIHYSKARAVHAWMPSMLHGDSISLVLTHVVNDLKAHHAWQMFFATFQGFVRKLSWAQSQPLSPAQRLMLKTRGTRHPIPGARACEVTAFVWYTASSGHVMSPNSFAAAANVVSCP